MYGRLGVGRRAYELIVPQCSRIEGHTVGGRSTNPNCPLMQRGGQRSLKGTVWCILQGGGTYNSRGVFLLSVVEGLKV